MEEDKKSYEVIVASATKTRGVVFGSSDRQASEKAFADAVKCFPFPASVYLRENGEVIASNENGD